MFQKRGKKVDDSITLVLTHHSALNQMDEILQRAHKHVLKSNRLHSALPSPPFQNAKTIREKLVRSKLKKIIKMLLPILVFILTAIYVKY